MHLSEVTHSWLHREWVAKKWNYPKFVLAISGKRCSGKSTAAKILGPEFEIPIVSLGFMIKSEYAKYASIDILDLYDRQKKELHRRGIQEYSNFRRSADNDCFVQKWCDQVSGMRQVICDDSREPHDNEMFEIVGAIPIRIRASEEVRTSLGYVPDPVVDSHPTEVGLDHLPDSYFWERGGAVIINGGAEHYNKYCSDLISLVGNLLGF